MTATPASTSPLDRLYGALRTSPVTRSRNRMIAGVCAGIAERTGVTVAVVRVLAVVLAIFGPGVVLYLLAWLLLPAADGRIRLEQALREGDAASIALLVVTVLALLPDAFFHPHVAWLPLVAVGVIAVVALRGEGRCGARAGHRSTSVPPVVDAGPGYRSDDGQPQDAPRS